MCSHISETVRFSAKSLPTELFGAEFNHSLPMRPVPFFGVPPCNRRARQRERARSRFAIDIKSNGKCSDASNSYSTNSAWVDTEKNEWKKHPTHPTRRIKSFCLRCCCNRSNSDITPFSLLFIARCSYRIFCALFSHLCEHFFNSRAHSFFLLLFFACSSSRRDVCVRSVDASMWSCCVYACSFRSFCFS